jgi:thymidylate synthase
VYISAASIDDLLRAVLVRLLKVQTRITPSRGPAVELTGITLRLRNPRARLSRTETKGKLFSCLGELFWYLAKTNDLKFITYYLSHYERESEDGRTVYGAYGPRLFEFEGRSPIGSVIELLNTNPASRRAVVPLFQSGDIVKKRKDVPCTCLMQFLVRSGRLHMLTYMRSNDVFLGLPHDVFAFTMLQELVARSVGAELGSYTHFVGSLHLYEADRAKARQYLREGWQSITAMPPMPTGDPWDSVGRVLNAERQIRNGQEADTSGLSEYWLDLVRLLQVYWHFRGNQTEEIVRLRKTISSRVYDTYVREKARLAIQRALTNRST